MDKLLDTGPRLDKQGFEEWIEALESGKYKQCTGQLKDRKNSYCCLGVLAEIRGMRIDPTGQTILIDGVSQSYKPIENLLGTSIPTECMLLNDYGHSFRDIAQYLRGELKSRNVN
jgi:hypothetical protein